MYKLPEGIRIPDNSEYPENFDVEEINRKRKSANIIEGYTMSDVKEDRFSFYAEINVDCDKIWGLFKSLTSILISEAAYGIISFKKEKPIMSDFTEKSKIVEIFNEYSYELANDGFLEFGIASDGENGFNEVFVSSFKYFNVWGTNKSNFRKIMDEFGLKENSNLNFIDEYPVVSIALEHSKNKHYSVVLDEVENMFKNVHAGRE